MQEPATDNNSLKHQVLHSLKWVALGKVVTQIFRWLITFWVIRLLLPEDYGVVAMADVLFSFLTLLIGSLIAPAIIQSKNLTLSILRQLFGFVLVLHLLVFLFQMIIADSVGNYYQSEHVASILKVNAWCFLIMAFGIIPSALLSKSMEFKFVSIATAIANITAAITTLWLAYSGFGFWSLIYGEIVAVSISTVLIFAKKPITFLPHFSIAEIKPFLTFGGLLTLHSILFYVFLFMDITIAGRSLSAAEIGLYSMGLQFALMPQKKILPLIKQVAFPAFAKIQDQPERIAQYIVKAQKLSLYLTIPVFWGLASVVDQIIPIILGERWVEAIVPTMIILLVMPLKFSWELFNPAFVSQKKINHLLVNIAILIVVMLISILVGMKYGAVGLSCAWLIGFPIGYVVVVNRNCKELAISVTSIAKLFVMPVIAGLTMLASVFLAKQMLYEIVVLNLLAQIAIGALVFATLLYVFDKKSLLEMKSMLKK